ncbi:serine peptidase [Streptomyces sp. NPDC051963]|uniref:serine peptidase n=1 Tax=Streptomyces sp. NPDC051963 TaxID=3365678 RepID=UPI0037CD2125
MTAIVAVHGVGHYASGHAPAEIVAARSATWAEELATGLGVAPEQVPLTYAYYAHHLHRNRPVSQGADALEQLEREHPEAIQEIAHWAETSDESLGLGLPSVTGQGRLAVPLRQLVSVIAERLSLDGRLTRAFIALFFREVALYLRHHEDPARIAAREEVATTIASASARVVVAHSLGTVVTYEALHAHPELDIELLLTLGSPLALAHGVFDRLSPAPTNGTGQRPAGVRRWVNLCDHGDIVAIPRPLKQRFPTVDLDLIDSIAPFDFHSAAPYLRSAAVAATLAPLLATWS